MVPIESWLSNARKFRQEHGRPVVTLSYAQSLDGCLSIRRGVATALSGQESIQLTHRLRAAHDAILVGIDTVLSDDPRLSVRLVDGPNPQPVVLDSQLRFPLDAKLLQGEVLPWIATNQEPTDPQTYHRRTTALAAQGVRLLPLPACDDGHLSLNALLAKLSDLGIDSLMVEGGARVITNFLVNRLVDQIVLTISPVLLGGLRAIERPLTFPTATTPELASIQTISIQHQLTEFPHLQEIGYDRLGDDLIVWGRLG